MNPAFNLRNPVVLLVGAVALIVILASTLAVVPETRQALIVRFGQPVAVVNGYRPSQGPGSSGAGLIVRVPFADQLVWVEKRAMDIDAGPQQLLSSDQRPLKVEAYARYRIADPLRMYLNAGSERRVADELRPVLGTALAEEIAARPYGALSGPDRDAVLRAVQARMAKAAHQYGAEVIDVRIKRADLPDGAPLQAALDKMKSVREQEAVAVDADGRKAAQMIRADADANVARIYAESFGKDADFYAFYRAMQSYRRTLGDGAAGGTAMILSPDNAYLREFSGRGR